MFFHLRRLACEHSITHSHTHTMSNYGRFQTMKITLFGTCQPDANLPPWGFIQLISQDHRTLQSDNVCVFVAAAHPRLDAVPISRPYVSSRLKEKFPRTTCHVQKLSLICSA